MIKHYIFTKSNLEPIDFETATPALLPFRLVAGDDFLGGDKKTYAILTCLVSSYGGEVIIVCYAEKVT